MGQGVEKRTESAKILKCKGQMVSAFSFVQIGTICPQGLEFGGGREREGMWFFSFLWSNLEPNPLHISLLGSGGWHVCTHVKLKVNNFAMPIKK